MEKTCKYCGSKQLYLDANGGNIMQTDRVALKCKSCGRWIKWVPKSERAEYAKNMGLQPEEIKAMETPAEDPNAPVQRAEEAYEACRDFAKKELYRLYNEVKSYSFMLRQDILTIIDEHIKALDTPLSK